MGSLFSVADPERVIETSAHDIGIELAAVSVVYPSLKRVTETIIGHALQLGDGTAVSFESGYTVGMAKDLDSINLDVELFFFGAPRLCAVLSEFLLEPFIDSLPFFEDHESARLHRL